MGYVQHWNDKGDGFGHADILKCWDECKPFPHTSFPKLALPPLSWETGHDPKDWVCDKCGATR